VNDNEQDIPSITKVILCDGDTIYYILPSRFIGIKPTLEIFFLLVWRNCLKNTEYHTTNASYVIRKLNDEAVAHLDTYDSTGD